MRGDCLKLLPELKNDSVDLVLADPPYGTTQNKWDSVIKLDDLWRELKRVAKPRCAIVMTSQQPFTTSLIASNQKQFKYCWVWVKDNSTGFLNAKKYPLKIHEDIVVFCERPHIYNPQMSEGAPYTATRHSYANTSNYGEQKDSTLVNTGVRHPNTLLRYKRDKDKVHPTQKPIALMEYLIRTYTNEGGAVLDFAMGSGTVGIACERAGRDFIGIEKDDEYFNLAAERISNPGCYLDCYDT